MIVGSLKYSRRSDVPLHLLSSRSPLYNLESEADNEGEKIKTLSELSPSSFYNLVDYTDYYTTPLKGLANKCLDLWQKAGSNITI